MGGGRVHGYVHANLFGEEKRGEERTAEVRSYVHAMWEGGRPGVRSYVRAKYRSNGGWTAEGVLLREWGTAEGVHA